MDMGPPLCNPMLLHEIGKGKARLGLEASAALCSKPLDHEEPPVFAHGVAVCHAGDIAGYLVSCHRSSVGLRWPSKRIAALHRLPIRSGFAARWGLGCAPVAGRRLRHLIRDATLAMRACAGSRIIAPDRLRSPAHRPAPDRAGP